LIQTKLLRMLITLEQMPRSNTSEVTLHLLTNAEVIRLFLPVEIRVDGPLGGPATVHLRPEIAASGGKNR